jgi:hypothetical protein
VTSLRPPTADATEAASAAAIAGTASRSASAAPSLLTPLLLRPCFGDEMSDTQRRLLRFLGHADGDWLALRANGPLPSSATGASELSEPAVDRLVWVRSLGAFERAPSLACRTEPREKALRPLVRALALVLPAGPALDQRAEARVA